MTQRIGLIIPSSNRMVEQEMVHHLPPGAVAHIARLRMTGAHRVTIDELIRRTAGEQRDQLAATTHLSALNRLEAAAARVAG